MRNLQKTLAFFGILITGGIGQLVGCANDAGNCELNYETCPGSSGVVAPPPGCTDSPSQNPEVIRSDCAYFVGGPNASDSNKGGESDPFASLAAAVNAAKTQKARVYLCGSVSERVDVPAGVSIFGGFDCSGNEWNYDAAQRGAITPAAPAMDAPFQSSIRITGNGTTKIEDINITAADGAFPGGSAIAVIIDKATVNFLRSDLTAGNGKDGSAGTTPNDNVGPSMVTDPAIAGNPGTEGCLGTAAGVEGGAAKVNMLCPESVGGKGGNGQVVIGDPGEDGMPLDPASGQGGEPNTGSGACADGTSGAAGMTGKAGTGATDLGTIDPTGFSGSTGTGGGKGSVGQGGGGGSGSKGKGNFYGAGGGSGGAGGCPGNGGSGGAAGGSSIGVIYLSGVVNFSSVKINTGTGGQGGAGGIGQFGGIGGNGGTRGQAKDCGMGTKVDSACDGGNGGDGGQGGQGGGGLGGHSIGIAHKAGTAAPNVMGADINISTAGAGGAGADTAGTGKDGTASNVFELK